MGNILIFAGSSCPELAASICTKLGTNPASVELSQFANGETSVQILTSIREKDVFVVQSGSSKVNDSIMELLILISACKGASANKITAVIPYFPYSRQSKKKYHRGSITARMLANLLNIAGVQHVITIDLHASQMQGFFRCPVDNLHAEPLISRWIRLNVLNWQEAVCVSKNAGGSKRVTSLADALKLNFGMITTDRKRVRRNKALNPSTSRHDACQLENIPDNQMQITQSKDETSYVGKSLQPLSYENNKNTSNETQNQTCNLFTPITLNQLPPETSHSKQAEISEPPIIPDKLSSRTSSTNQITGTIVSDAVSSLAYDEVEFTDERARDIIQGRLIHGHIVPDDYPSPSESSVSTSIKQDGLYENPVDPPTLRPSQPQIAVDSDQVEPISEDEEETFITAPFEHMITLVGDVRNRTVLIIDDMIDKAGSWIAAAECVVKRGGACKVLCIATHGLFGGSSLEELQDCDCIDTIVVTNSFPIPLEKASAASKLVILDLSNLLSEAIRRNHFGESMSALFTHSID